MTTDKKIITGWIIIWTLFSVILLLNINSVGDNGDGIMHYLFARYSHLHPLNFLDPWAKSGYTLVAWPFAQFGLKGIMAMNIISVMIVMWLIFRIGELLNIKYPWFAPIILSVSTYYFKLTFSGLTEHAFACMLILSIFLLLKNNWIGGAIVLSLLPFFRQEGYILIASLLPYFFIKNKWKFIPLLFTGFIIYAIVGAISYKDLFWIIHSNPYGFQMSYGQGKWYTFLVHFYYNAGLLNLITFLLALLLLVLNLIQKPDDKSKNLFWLAVFPLVIFVTAHSYFWYAGIFHSMGLQRVLNCVTPLWAIIAGSSLSYVEELLKLKRIKNWIIITTIVLIVLFPFLPSPANINWSHDFKLTKEELVVKNSCEFVKQEYPNTYYIAEHPLVFYFLNINPFDISTSSRAFYLDKVNVTKGSILIWDNGFTLNQAGITTDYIEGPLNYKLIKEFNAPNSLTEIKIYQK